MGNIIKPKIAIIDYKMNNLFSVQNACEFVGLDAEITTDKIKILNADGAILPGVGAFHNAMNNLERLDLIEPIRDFIATGKPFLGICLGLQLLFTESYEFGTSRGLNLIEGTVEKFDFISKKKINVKVPHIGWNQIYPSNNQETEWKNSPLHGIKKGEYMYFVHSFYIAPSNENDIFILTKYKGFEYCSGIKKKNIFATQFHPEKSAQKGIQIYSNWAKMIVNK